METGLLASASLGCGLLFAFLLAAWASGREGEPQAAVRLGLTAFVAPAPFFAPLVLPDATGHLLAWTLLALSVLVGVVFLVPIKGMGLKSLDRPVRGVDERDIMFSRATLPPGSGRFEAYYRSRPENRALDDRFREAPGLLSPGSKHFHPLGFAAADAAFWTIELLREFVEGGESGWREGGEQGHESPGQPRGSKEGGEVRAGIRLGGEPVAPAAVEAVEPNPEAMSRFLKAWTLKLGAHSVGVTELRDHHLYTHVGRGPEYGKPVALDHTYALAITVEMDKEMVDRAPRSPTAMESAHQYVRCGVMAVQLADLIRRLGYHARAHIDGHYRVICPLVAKDAGLGEIGRMGLLMTPRLGPRVRIAVVTTDMPLATDAPAPDLTTLDFCRQCKKCAVSCPSRALPFGPPVKDENGVLRWKVDSEACFTLWARLGTDCARCMAVCPYSHPDNAMHGFVRWGIRNNALFRRAAVHLDDLVYGGRPTPKGELGWIEGA